jgi:hypothetical protein
VAYIISSTSCGCGCGIIVVVVGGVGVVGGSEGGCGSECPMMDENLITRNV